MLLMKVLMRGNAVLPDYADVENAASRLKGFAVRTPVIQSVKLDHITGGRVLIGIAVEGGVSGDIVEVQLITPTALS